MIFNLSIPNCFVKLIIIFVYCGLAKSSDSLCSLVLIWFLRFSNRYVVIPIANTVLSHLSLHNEQNKIILLSIISYLNHG